jgi:hypothetical protein
MHDFTFEESSLSKNERALLLGLLNDEPMVETPKMEKEPRKESVERIIAYNKALSVRKSRTNGNISFLLN